MRWRKPMGHLFHSIKWKRPGKGDVEGVNARKSWIRTTPTKRGTSECVYIERGR
uniref:Uncharacterized protein n=1 Tax=Rhizophora mucronata TaxID=61149 RepID=A0A2P2QW74_RHIMU